MLSISNSRYYAEALSDNLTEYIKNISSLNQVSVWNGTSRDSIVQKAMDFYGEYNGPLNTQAENFSLAVVNYNRYVESKRNYEYWYDTLQDARVKYEEAVNAKNENDMAYYQEKISRHESQCSEYSHQMRYFKNLVNELLKKVQDVKFEDTREWTYIDQRKYHVPYGYDEHGNRAYIDESGCGPTSLAMVASYLTQEDHGVEEVADWAVINRDAKGNQYRPPGGTSWNLFPDYSATLGINCKLVTQTSSVAQNANNIESELRNGNLIIALMNTGFFTRGGGHYIVLRGLDENGKIIVSDPYHPEKNNDTYDVDFIADQCKNSRYIAVMEG